MTCNLSGFPKLSQVETASVSESQVFEQKKSVLFSFAPEAIAGDNAYFKAMRVRNWASEGVVLLTPATKWQNGHYAIAYHHFIAEEPFKSWLKSRKTAIEPIFDIISKVLGTKNNHKQLPIQQLDKAQSFLCLGVLAVQIAMIINNVLCWFTFQENLKLVDRFFLKTLCTPLSYIALFLAENKYTNFCFSSRYSFSFLR